jgi:hypothetical protein
MTNWRLSDNRSVTDLLLNESVVDIVILYQDDIQRANIIWQLKENLGHSITSVTLWSIKLLNQNTVRFVTIQQAQIETRGINISLLLFPDSIEYNVRREITRELTPNMISSGGITGTIRV